LSYAPRVAEWWADRACVIRETPLRRAVTASLLLAPVVPLLSVLGAVLGFEEVLFGSWFGSWLILMVMLVAPFVLLGFRRLPWTGGLHVELRDDELRLRTPKGSLRAVRSIHDVPLAWRARQDEVRLVTYGGDEIRVGLGTTAEAQELLRTIRERTRRSRRVYGLPVDGELTRLVRAWWSWGTFTLVGTTALLFGPSGLPVAGGAAVLAWLAARSSRRVTFGADGLTVRGWFRSRYVAYRDVEAVELESRGLGLRPTVRLRLRDGRTVLVGRFFDVLRAHLVRGLLEEGRRVGDRGREAGAEVGGLDRGDEAAERFRERVSALTRASYRDPTLTPDKLFDVMRNPAADPAQRASAALALRDNPGGIARIRVAADVSADPKVRSAFEELAAEEPIDEGRLDRLLSRVARPR